MQTSLHSFALQKNKDLLCTSKYLILVALTLRYILASSEHQGMLGFELPFEKEGKQASLLSNKSFAFPRNSMTEPLRACHIINRQSSICSDTPFANKSTKCLIPCHLSSVTFAAFQQCVQDPRPCEPRRRVNIRLVKEMSASDRLFACFTTLLVLPLPL